MSDKIELKASFTADDTGAISGTAWGFNSADRVGDVIEPQAFASAVGKTLPMLFAHDQAQAVGVWNSVAVEADGLKVTGKLLVGEVARADEVRSLIKAGGVTGLSLAARLAAAAPGSKVLFVCVEACTLAFRTNRLEKADIIATILFGDGAAAAVLSTGDEGPEFGAGAEDVAVGVHGACGHLEAGFAGAGVPVEPAGGFSETFGFGEFAHGRDTLKLIAACA